MLYGGQLHIQNSFFPKNGLHHGQTLIIQPPNSGHLFWCHTISTCTTFSEKLTFLTPWWARVGAFCVQVHVSISELEMVRSPKKLRTS